MSLLSLNDPPGWTVCSALCILIVLLPEAKADDPNATAQRNGGGSQCGGYTNQVMEDGMCRLVATLPQLDEQKCPDMFRCADEVSYWLHQNEERKQQIAALKETVSGLQRELRNHRHRIHVLELQSEERNHLNTSLEQRLYELEHHYAEATTLLHLQSGLILDLQNHLHNLTVLVDNVKKSPGCLINIPRPNPLMSAQEALHSESARNCPIDCASIYYNGVRRSGLYTVVPSRAGVPVEVYCDMDTDGQRRLDCDPAARRRLLELRPQLEGLQGRFWGPALRVLAGQQSHPRPEHPGGLQPPRRPGGLEQRAQARPLPELQRGRRGASVPSARVRLQWDGEGLVQLVPRQAGLQHAGQRQHLRRDLARRLVVQPVLLRQPQRRLLQGRPLHPQRPGAAGSRWDRLVLVEGLGLLLPAQGQHDDPTALLPKPPVAVTRRDVTEEEELIVPLCPQRRRPRSWYFGPSVHVQI